MLPPIPDPVTPIKLREKGSRPSSLAFFIAINIIWPLMNFVSGGNANQIGLRIAFLSTQVVMGLLYYALWIGKNWARIVLIVLNAIGIMGLLLIGMTPESQRQWTVIQAIISAIMLWWLCSPAIVQFCKGKPV